MQRVTRQAGGASRVSHLITSPANSWRRSIPTQAVAFFIRLEKIVPSFLCFFLHFFFPKHHNTHKSVFCFSIITSYLNFWDLAPGLFLHAKMWDSLFQPTRNSTSFTFFSWIYPPNWGFYLFIHRHGLIFYGQNCKSKSGFECIK